MEVIQLNLRIKRIQELSVVILILVHHLEMMSYTLAIRTMRMITVLLTVQIHLNVMIVLYLLVRKEQVIELNLEYLIMKYTHANDHYISQ